MLKKLVVSNILYLKVVDKQSNRNTAGEYYLRGIPEMASGFKLNDNNSFQFFLAYGALDRYGSGLWKVENNQVILQSKPWSGKDFALLESKTINDNAVTVRVTDRNPHILRYVYSSLQKEIQGSWLPADKDGITMFPKQEVSVISMVFEFCPERVSSFANENPGHNYFLFRFEPWVAEFFFNDFSLEITEDGLKGKHPVLKGEEFKYEKR
jgi:hypothetical protein